MRVDKRCKCRHCHWYRPRKEQRCWGFNEADIKDCIEHDYWSFRFRDIKVLRKIEENHRWLANKI